jgi:hypothetical protein
MCAQRIAHILRIVTEQADLDAAVGETCACRSALIISMVWRIAPRSAVLPTPRRPISAH